MATVCEKVESLDVRALRRNFGQIGKIDPWLWDNTGRFFLFGGGRMLNTQGLSGDFYSGDTGYSKYKESSAFLPSPSCNSLNAVHCDRQQGESRAKIPTACWMYQPKVLTNVQIQVQAPFCHMILCAS